MYHKSEFNFKVVKTTFLVVLLATVAGSLYLLGLYADNMVNGSKPRLQGKFKNYKLSLIAKLLIFI